MEQQWISVNERFPGFDVLVLVHYAEFITKKDPEWKWTKDGCRYAVAKFSSKFNNWLFENSDGQWDTIAAPTHWMPLPAPPNQ